MLNLFNDLLYNLNQDCFYSHYFLYPLLIHYFLANDFHFFDLSDHVVNLFNDLNLLRYFFDSLSVLNDRDNLLNHSVDNLIFNFDVIFNFSRIAVLNSFDYFFNNLFHLYQLRDFHHSFHYLFNINWHFNNFFDYLFNRN